MDCTGLASLQARADDKGDHFLVNGSKVWISYGEMGDWMFCLVRTDFKGKKQEGISFIMFDMTSPGVSTQPIKLISGKPPVTETFMENLQVEKNQVVGEINKGWTVAKYLLTHEREMIDGAGQSSTGSMPLNKTAADIVGVELVWQRFLSPGSICPAEGLLALCQQWNDTGD